MAFFDKCEEYFDTRNLYEILGVDKDADEKKLKKGYHRVSLLVHPDRVPPAGQALANEKFKVLGRVYMTLSNEDKRRLYDQTGGVDEDDSECDWMTFWRSIFKPITRKDIDDYRDKYKDSEEEIRDVRKAYEAGRGDIKMFYELVPFFDIEDEDRVREIVQRLVDDGRVERFSRFFEESKRTRDQRHRKRRAERDEVPDGALEDLEEELLKKREQRERDFGDFMSTLESKYAKPKAKAIKANGSSTSGSKRSKK